MTRDAKTDHDPRPRGNPTVTRDLDRIDDIRALLSPQRLAARGRTAENRPGTRLWVDGKPCMVYPVPQDARRAADMVRVARDAAAILAARRDTQLRGLMTDAERRACTLRNLDRLRVLAEAERGRRAVEAGRALDETLGASL